MVAVELTFRTTRSLSENEIKRFQEKFVDLFQGESQLYVVFNLESSEWIQNFPENYQRFLEKIRQCFEDGVRIETIISFSAGE